MAAVCCRSLQSLHVACTSIRPGRAVVPGPAVRIPAVHNARAADLTAARVWCAHACDSAAIRHPYFQFRAQIVSEDLDLKMCMHACLLINPDCALCRLVPPHRLHVANLYFILQILRILGIPWYMNLSLRESARAVRIY